MRKGIKYEFHKIYESRRLAILEYGTNGRKSEILHRWNEEKRMALQLYPDMTLFWLSEFALEIKQKDGAENPPNTLYQICAGLQRALRENGLPEFDIFRYPKYNDYSKISLIRE